MPEVNEGEGVIERVPGVRWGSAFAAGVIAAGILLVLPWGSPWAGISFFSPIVMGRPMPPDLGISSFEAALLHLIVACAYSVVIATIINTFRPDRALLLGALVGIGLYGVNWAVFRFFAPGIMGPEWPVALAHLVFGLLTTAIYRGLAKRPAPQ